MTALSVFFTFSSNQLAQEDTPSRHDKHFLILTAAVSGFAMFTWLITACFSSLDIDRQEVP